MTLFQKHSARALWLAGDRARDAQNWGEARASYAEALKLSPSRCGLWLQYGNAAKEGGDVQEAEAAYRTALVIDPRRKEAHLALAHLLKGQGRWRDAANHFQKVLQLDSAADVQSELALAKAQATATDPDATGINSEALDRSLRRLGGRLRGSLPNVTHYGQRFAHYEIAMLNVKTIGYALARALGGDLNTRVVSAPPDVALGSKPCTQSDVESQWMAFWAQELKSPVRYHRKLWEFCYLAQVLWQAGKLRPGCAGLGFGCGNEPLVGLFAKHGVRVLATDLPAEQAHSSNWQTAATDDIRAYRSQFAEVCPEPALRENIAFRPVDMREIPQDLNGSVDFCWSACSLEHLGSIENGLNFIEASLRTLKPGGVAVHTTEFNLDDGATIDHWSTVLFQRKHLLALAERLQQQGYRVAPMDFAPGDGFLDGFVDIPPWSQSDHPMQAAEPDAHLKLSLDGFICTSFGISIFAPNA